MISCLIDDKTPPLPNDSNFPGFMCLHIIFCSIYVNRYLNFNFFFSYEKNCYKNHRKLKKFNN